MAMDKDRLGTALKDRIKADFSVIFSGMDEANFETLMQGIADEIIKEITLHAEVSTTVMTTVTGTLPVGPVAASGTGSGTGSVA